MYRTTLVSLLAITLLVVCVHSQRDSQSRIRNPRPPLQQRPMSSMISRGGEGGAGNAQVQGGNNGNFDVGGGNGGRGGRVNSGGNLLGPSRFSSGFPSNTIKEGGRGGSGNAQVQGGDNGNFAVSGGNGGDGGDVSKRQFRSDDFESRTNIGGAGGNGNAQVQTGFGGNVDVSGGNGGNGGPAGDSFRGPDRGFSRGDGDRFQGNF